jgi:glycosyltransferase involved in cell wall biosynthesis
VNPPIVVVLASYNGAKHIEAQLDSIAAQSVRPSRLLVFDDRSTDETQTIVQARSKREPYLELTVNRLRRGFAENFLNGLSSAADGESAIAFSDQDDIWLPEKLSRALAALADVPAGLPGLYASRQYICDADARPGRLSPDYAGPFDFANALVQNVVTGCTAVLNPAAATLIGRADWAGATHHDWLAYQLVAGSGGVIIFDHEAHILYRQHSNSTIGSPSVFQRYHRGWMRLRRGRTKQYVDRSMRVLQQNARLLQPEACDLMNRLRAYREAPTWKRLWSGGRLPVRRQTVADTMILHALLISGCW